MGIINPFDKGNVVEETRTITQDGPELRLLACGKCKSIEILDDYTGPPERAAEYDVILNIAVEKHQDGVERVPHAPAALVRVKVADWQNEEVQDSIRKQIMASFDPNAETGLGAEAYAIRDNFKEDAMACFEQHLRNPACSDYRSESKQLVPDTASERKAAGLPKFERGNPATQRYLCDYCPVHSLVVQAQRKRVGLYDQ